MQCDFRFLRLSRVSCPAYNDPLLSWRVPRRASDEPQHETEFLSRIQTAYEEYGGRVPIIRKDLDKNVSHAKTCYMCIKGTAPKRLLQVKPRRRKEKRQLQAAVLETLNEQF